jgi:hypothetical protein
MSKANVELARSGYAAIASGELDAPGWAAVPRLA